MSPEDLTHALAPLDPLQRKVLGTVTLTMIQHHDKVKDQEWFAAQFTSAVALAMDMEDVSSTAEGVGQVQEYAQAQVRSLGGLAYALFTQVATDMQARVAKQESFTFEDAAAQVMHYVGST